MSDVLAWEDPPPRGYPTVWVSLLKPLLDRPGAWARVKDCKTLSSAYQASAELSRRRYTIPPGRWEFRSAKNGTGGSVYARYLGPDEAAK